MRDKINHILILLATVLPVASPRLLAATPDNRIVAVTALDTAETVVMRRITLYDGLGRERRVVNRDYAPEGSGDLVTRSTFDGHGRFERMWLPTPVADGCSLSDSDIEAAAVTTYSDSRPYAYQVYEQSPLDSVTTRYGAGSLWTAAHGVAHEVYANDQTVLLRCADIQVADSGELTLHGWRTTGTLKALRSSDEDGNITYNFTDWEGRTVLARRVAGSQCFDTYFVFDDWGDLRYILPPLAVAAMSMGSTTATYNVGDGSTIDKLCFVCRYDDYGRCIYRKLPGCEPVYYVYDRCDNVVYSQDGVQRQGKKWTFTMRDKFGRVVYSGQTVDTRTVEQLRAAWTGISPRAERADGENAVGYTIPTELTGITARKINLVNYYDDYGFIANFAVNQQQMLTYDEMEDYDGRYDTAGSGLTACGRLTGTAARVLSGTSTTTTLLPTAFYYDIHGNVIQTRAVNHRGGREVERNRLTFTGKPLTVRREHTSGATVTNPTVEVYNYTYDQVERPLTCSLSVDGGTAMQLSAAYYNELGQTAETELLDAVATISYGYNVRGWVRSIGCGNIFSQNLYYADAPSGATARWGGDVSANYWRCGTSEQVGMRYGYDGVGRLTQARSVNQFNDYTTNYTYDLAGNMTQLRRMGVRQKIHHIDPLSNEDIYLYVWDVIDNVTLNYDGNRLVKADDARAALTYAGAMDFRDGADETTEYLWDADGRLTRDLNKGIYEVQYNLIGLPSKTHFFNGNIIYTDYAADGRKLQTRYVYDSNEVAVIESDGGDDISGSGDLDELFGSMAAVGGSVAQPDGGLIPGGDLIEPEPLPLVQLLGKRDYCGGHIYLNDTIERVLTPVGYYNAIGDHFAYVKDWQGNVRVTVDQNGNVVEAVDYYPYGMVMEKGNEIATGAQPYKYGGKELDRRFGYDSYDFEARVYDPALGRFTQPDPLAWDTPEISPYVYCAANPIRYVDPSGKVVQFADGVLDMLGDSFMQLMEESTIFKTIYNSLDKSDIVYYVDVGPTPKNATAYYNTENKSITINPLLVSNTNSVAEEFVHGYQDENGILNADGINVEYEAKLIVNAAIGEIENDCLSTGFFYDPSYEQLGTSCLNAMMDKRIPLNIFIKGGLEFIQHYKSLGKTDDAYVRNITRASNVIQQFISVR